MDSQFWSLILPVYIWLSWLVFGLVLLIIMSDVRFLLFLLFFPLLLVFLISWVIYWKLSGKKQAIREKKHKKQQKKVLTHIRNFSPVRLKNRRWWNISKQQTKKPKKSPKHPSNQQK